MYAARRVLLKPHYLNFWIFLCYTYFPVWPGMMMFFCCSAQVFDPIFSLGVRLVESSKCPLLILMCLLNRGFKGVFHFELELITILWNFLYQEPFSTFWHVWRPFYNAMKQFCILFLRLNAAFFSRNINKHWPLMSKRRVYSNNQVKKQLQ